MAAHDTTDSSKDAHGHAVGDPLHGADPGHITPIRDYLVVFALLMVLLVVTVYVSHLDIGTAGTVVAFIIASIKGALIILYFMHVRHASKLTWVFALAAFLWLGIMLVLAMNDYLTRDRLSRGQPISEIIERRPAPAEHPEKTEKTGAVP